MGNNLRIKVISLCSVVLIALVGCRNTQRNIDIVETIEDVEYLINLRYNGVSDSDFDRIKDLIGEEATEIVYEHLDTKEIEEPLFISLEYYYDIIGIGEKVVEENIITGETIESEYIPSGYTSENVMEVEGERGVYSDTISANSDGTFDIYLYSILYSPKLTNEQMAVVCKHSPTYKLKVTGYNLYDDNTLYVTASTDLNEAFNDVWLYSHDNIPEKEEEEFREYIEAQIRFSENVESVKTKYTFSLRGDKLVLGDDIERLVGAIES